MVPANLITAQGLHLGVVIIQVVELKLHHFDLGILRQNPIQHLGAVVEGDAQMPDFSLRLQLQRRLIGPAALVFWKPLPALGVHQVEIKIVYPAGVQLLPEQGPDVLLLLKKIVGQLVGQNIALPWIPGGQAGLQCLLALPAKVAVGGVKIVEARRQKGIHHLRGLLDIHRIAHHRQAHKAKTELLLNFRKDRFHIHVSFTFCCGAGLS